VLPSLAEVRRMVGEVADAGLRSQRGLLRQPMLLGLACVARRAQSPDPRERAVALRAIVLELIDELSDAELRVVARYLFGLAAGRMATKQSRLEDAGKEVSHSWETLRKNHAPELLDEIADRLVQLERMERTLQAMERAEPVGEELALVYLRRAHRYSTMAYHAGTTANNLRAALRTPAEEPPHPIDSRADLLWAALHGWTWFSQTQRRYMSSFDDMWMTTDPAANERVIVAVHALDRDAPFSYRDASWLRLRLLDARDFEVDAFIEQLEASERGERLLGQWFGWADQCRCTSRPRRTCPPHAFVAAATCFYHTMRAEWKTVATWYRKPGSDRVLRFPDGLM
jgi:hypothetical protein